MVELVVVTLTQVQESLTIVQKLTVHIFVVVVVVDDLDRSTLLVF